MHLRELRNIKFYNLIVTSDDTAWEVDKYEMERSRFLEYTNPDIRAKYIHLNDKALEDISKFPCLFLYELDRKNYGYIGYITKIKERTKKIGFKFEKVTKIPIDDVIKLAFELDIDTTSKYITELNRTHWAIKEVNLLQELEEYNNDLVPASPKIKVFISYSWGSIETREKVQNLVEQLESDDIDVIYDKKSLHLGNDITFFMEKLSNDPTIKKVLVICDESYTQKANLRRSGVGTETEIIIPEVYSKPLQNKIIPVFFEKNEYNEIVAPIFLKNRFGVDFTLGNEENNYPLLLENIRL